MNHLFYKQKIVLESTINFNLLSWNIDNVIVYFIFSFNFFKVNKIYVCFIIFFFIMILDSTLHTDSPYNTVLYSCSSWFVNFSTFEILLYTVCPSHLSLLIILLQTFIQFICHVFFTLFNMFRMLITIDTVNDFNKFVYYFL